MKGGGLKEAESWRGMKGGTVRSQTGEEEEKLLSDREREEKRKGDQTDDHQRAKG